MSRITKKERDEILNINNMMIDSLLDDKYTELSNLNILLNDKIGAVMSRLYEEDYSNMIDNYKKNKNKTR